MNNLSAEEMAIVGEVFVASFEHAKLNINAGLNKAANIESDEIVDSFVTELVLHVVPYAMMSSSNLFSITERIFKVEQVRDFIFNLQFIFFSRLGYDAAFISGLTSNISRGLHISGATNGKQEGVLTPKVITDRLPTEVEINTMLSNNKWLLIIVLIQLYVKIDFASLKKKENK